MTLNKLVLCGIVAVAAAAHKEAQAFGWRHHGSWGSSGGSSGGSWGSSGGSWGSSGGSHGWRRHGLFHRHHSSGGSWGSSGGSSGGSWGSSGGSSGGSWGSSGGSSGGSWGSSGGSSGGEVYMEGDAMPMDASPAEGEAAPAEGSTTYIPDARSVVLTVRVPANAKVFVNDYETTSTGTVRRFVSRDLNPGSTYSFAIRSEITRDGKTVARDKTVTVRAGETANLAFDFNKEAEAVASADARTSLTVIVPADAKVFLAGNATASTGEIRTFATSKLAGDEWNSYPVRVELERDGQTLVKEATVSLKAGDNQELRFEFNDDKLNLVASK